MSKILVIADDLTGAAEIAGIAYRFGLSVSIRLMNGQIIDSGDDVLVVDSDTRNLEEERVAPVMESILGNFLHSEDLFIYKKTDSLLRGWITGEILSILRLTNLSSALLIPANPTRNRTIRSGNYYLDGKLIDQTEYANDPEQARNHSDVIYLIKDRTINISAGNINWNDRIGKIIIPDITSIEDVRTIIDDKIRSDMLLCGSADFFQELLASKLKKKPSAVSIKLNGPEKRIFITCSYASTNRTAIKQLVSEGFVEHQFPLQILNAPLELNAWKARVTELTYSLQNTILSCPQQFVSEDSLMESITEMLIDIAAQVAKEKPPIHFFITGGKTAALFCKKLGWSHLSIQKVWEPGIVTLSCKESEHLLTIKPGSYQWPDDILKMEI